MLFLKSSEKNTPLMAVELCGGTTDPAPAPIASKEPEKGKRYFGLYLLVGGRKPYTIWNPIYCKDSWRDYPLP
jgi:hypothetical protein